MQFNSSIYYTIPEKYLYCRIEHVDPIFFAYHICEFVHFVPEIVF
jgi:hypothetical protein